MATRTHAASAGALMGGAGGRVLRGSSLLLACSSRPCARARLAGHTRCMQPPASGGPAPLSTIWPHVAAAALPAAATSAASAVWAGRRSSSTVRRTMLSLALGGLPAIDLCAAHVWHAAACCRGWGCRHCSMRAYVARRPPCFQSHAPTRGLLDHPCTPWLRAGDTCNCCYSIQLRETHRCIQNSMHHNCSVCME